MTRTDDNKRIKQKLKIKEKTRFKTSTDMIFQPSQMKNKNNHLLCQILQNGKAQNLTKFISGKTDTQYVCISQQRTVGSSLRWLGIIITGGHHSRIFAFKLLVSLTFEGIIF